MKNILNQYKIAISMASVLFITSCKDTDTGQVIDDKKSWTLSWSDEFNGTSGTQPDATKWSYDLGTGTDGWGNQELQSYTNSTNNIAMDGQGNLVITAIKNGNSYTSARIKTAGKFSQKYGRFEARIKTPYGPGIWPAFWMLGENISTVSWPQCGEIDIMELKGNQPNVIYGSLHGPGYSGGNALTSSHALFNERYDTNYHTFAVEWTENKIDFYMDNYLFKTRKKSEISSWVFNTDFYLLLNLAVGGAFVGFPTDGTPFPQKMIVDYIRVYK